LGIGLVLGLFGCSTKGDLFVLMPDDDGSVGQVTVATRGGTEVLSRAGQAVSVYASDLPPEPFESMQPAEIEKMFGPALAAQPSEPLHFLLYFESDSADLTTESAVLIDDILTAIRRHFSLDISIVGHTDRAGSEDYNLKLSLMRAHRVEEILIERGVAPNLIEVASHGEGNPLVPTADNVAEPRNRRVEVVVR
jgi:outer membrane protein OmpA-like peptidoglycan-associated protein